VIFLRPEGGLRLSEALPDRTGSVENAVLADRAVGVRNRSLEIADLGSEIRDLRFQVSTAALRALAAGMTETCGGWCSSVGRARPW
jgi:hypothetical protein